AEEFVSYWINKGAEKQDTHNFWIELLQYVYGVESPTKIISREKSVTFEGSTKYIDVYILHTKVLVEQKGAKIDLSKKEKQSDGTELTPYEQAKRYADWMDAEDRPHWIVVCNFQTFEIYNNDHPNEPPIHLELKDLPKAYNTLSFLTNLNDTARKVEMDISVKAGELIGKLYDALLKQYGEGRERDEETLKSLNKLCVRIVFCLYAEDSGVFPIKDQFGNFLRGILPENVGDGLEKLFKVLNTKKEDRKASLAEKYREFPYVNGGLFADDDSEIPPFDQNVYDILLKECSEEFDWSQISPTIFGAIFESTLNPETRRSGGMHYTSIENIHKVIDPLFLNELKEELASITNDEETKYNKRGRDKLRAFQNKLASLKFLDPACGSGNFLTETFICLRRLENEVLRHLGGDMQDLFILLEDGSPVKVQLKQFYGIEINDFAVTVAKTALWIAESQLLQETESILGTPIDFLPLKTYANNIVEGNALRIDWNDVIPASELNYIMGNPPFLGYSNQSKEQKEDMLSIYVDEKGKPYKTAGKIDYVAGWYMKAANYINGTDIQCAFVSTNSITQGEQVSSVWIPLIKRFRIKINFAWQSFKWTSDSSDVATVYVVIIGFSYNERSNKQIFTTQLNRIICEHINPYLINSEDIFIESRRDVISNVPCMITGNRPADGGALIIENNDYEDFLKNEPNAKKYIKKLIGADEFIKNKKRYCLWLVGVSPKDLNSMPLVLERVKKCKEERLKGAPDRQKLADTPTLFRETHNPEQFIIVPKVSSSNRKYVPMGLGDKDLIVTDLLFIIPNSNLFHFGMLNSIVHNAWMRTVCGRLGIGYRYSRDIVYNNFIWAEATEQQKEQISKTAQAILDARALYPDSSLADLYDPLTMPPELLKAHKANDKAVLALYGFKPDTTEDEIVAKLMQMYAEKVKQIG
ncbi:MAG: DNA methyltransferase, partial [Succinivibrio sp.]